MINHSLFNKNLLKSLIFPTGITLRFSFIFTFGFIYLLVFIDAPGNCSRAIQAFLLPSWQFFVLSFEITTESSSGSVGRYLVFAAATISIVFYSNVPAKRVSLKPRALGIIFLGIFPVVLSFLFISIVGVFLLNVVFFILVLTTLAYI